jgi:ParB family chromosome partitioning protein
MTEVREIEIDRIVIPEVRARASFDPDKFEELKASIKTHGFTIPILVRAGKDESYELIDGEHRLKVAKELGMVKVPAVVVSADDKKATLLNVLANTARGTQNPMDVAEALKRASDAGATIEELAAATGHDVRWVKLYLALNDLPDEYKQALRDGRLRVGHVEEAMRLPNPEEVDAALQTALSLGWTVSTLKYYVQQRLDELERARASGNPALIAPPPTIDHAQTLVQYGDCMFCRRKIDRKQLMMPVMCPECRSLLEYVLDQLGEPGEAIQIVYKALVLYFDMQEKMKREQELMQSQAVQAQSQVTLQSTSSNTQDQKDQELSEEDLKLVKLLKVLKKEGII